MSHWTEQASCRGKTWLMYPTFGDDVQAALDVCASCPVTTECRQASRGEEHGVWAGELRSVRRRRASGEHALRSKACVTCGMQGCRVCPPTLNALRQRRSRARRRVS